jgi:carbon monoxide dehydrogenase subunit G
MNVSVSRQVDAPPAQVWAIVTDFAGAPQRISAIKRLEVITDGPVGKGTRFRETRIMFKKEATEEMTITAWNPPYNYAIECESCGAHFRSVISCTPASDGAGTIIEMSMATKPISFMAKLMSPLGKLFAGACMKACEQDLNDLKRAAENGAVAQPA